MADLKKALLVDDKHLPLSFAAADAVSSAEMHDYVSVGGAISKVSLEAAVTRFATLPDVAYILVPIGGLPMIDESNAPLGQTCWRLDVLPTWAQHTHFVVDIPLERE